MIRTSALVALCLVANLPAQRAKTEVELTGRSVRIDYGAVRVGKHSLDSLPVGADWRMGSNEASTLEAQLPIVAGSWLVPPGSYRVKIYRAEESKLALWVEGAGLPIGTRLPGARLPGDLGETAKKPPKKLQLEFEAEEAQGKSRDASLGITFGEHRLAVPMTLIGAIPIKGKGWKGEVFAYPVEILDARLKKGLGTPIAKLTKSRAKRKEPSDFNLVVTEQSAKLVPLMSAPTESFGFGEVAPPPAEFVLEGEVQWGASQSNEPADELVPVKFEPSRKTLRLDVAVGGRQATIVFEL